MIGKFQGTSPARISRAKDALKKEEDEKAKAQNRTFINEDATMSAFGLKPLEIPEKKK